MVFNTTFSNIVVVGAKSSLTCKNEYGHAYEKICLVYTF